MNTRKVLTQQNGVANTDIHTENNKIAPLPHSAHKNQLKWSEGSKVRKPEPLTVLGEKWRIFMTFVLVTVS